MSGKRNKKLNRFHYSRQDAKEPTKKRSATNRKGESLTKGEKRVIDQRIKRKRDQEYKI